MSNARDLLPLNHRSKPCRSQRKRLSVKPFLWIKMCVSVCAVNKREQIQTLLESNTKISLDKMCVCVCCD